MLIYSRGLLAVGYLLSGLMLFRRVRWGYYVAFLTLAGSILLPYLSYFRSDAFSLQGLHDNPVNFITNSADSHLAACSFMPPLRTFSTASGNHQRHPVGNTTMWASQPDNFTAGNESVIVGEEFTAVVVVQRRINALPRGALGAARPEDCIQQGRSKATN